MADQQKSENNGREVKKFCGIIMPISESDGYSAAHWEEVRNILEEVIEQCQFTAKMVSDSEEVGIIHNRIVTNIYNNPIVVCDVSSKNPNVMFELGLRLAFDKATIVIKDDITNYNFDTSPIEHLLYPKDLRYKAINKFKILLKDKLVATYEASLKDDYSTFLKHFIQFKAKIETKEIDSQEYLFKRLDTLENLLIQTVNQRTSFNEEFGKSGFSGYSGSKPASAPNVYKILKDKFNEFVTKNEGETRKTDRNEIKNNFIFYLKSLEDLRLLLSKADMDRLASNILDDELPKWEGKWHGSEH